MGKRKGRQARRNATPPSSSSVQKGPNFTGDTGGSSSVAAPNECQIGPTRSSMPSPPPMPNAKAASLNTIASGEILILVLKPLISLFHFETSAKIFEI